MKKQILTTIILLLIFVFFLNTTIEAKSCSSDYSCRSDEVCVKAPYKSKGVCMKTADNSGMKTYPKKSTDSILTPLEGECISSVDCPIGFSCSRKYKVCVKR